jgi:hypothetical protein
MLACKFGCDDLYEHGWIGVGADGNLLISEMLPAALGIHPHMEILRPRVTGSPLAELVAGRRRTYFGDHYTSTVRKPLS